MRISAIIKVFYHLEFYNYHYTQASRLFYLAGDYISHVPPEFLLLCSLTIRGAIMSLIFSLHTSAGFLSKFGHFKMSDVSHFGLHPSSCVTDVLEVVRESH